MNPPKAAKSIKTHPYRRITPPSIPLRLPRHTRSFPYRYFPETCGMSRREIRAYMYVYPPENTCQHPSRSLVRRRSIWQAAGPFAGSFVKMYSVNVKRFPAACASAKNAGIHQNPNQTPANPLNASRTPVSQNDTSAACSPRTPDYPWCIM